jgi:hypothetical protein
MPRIGIALLRSLMGQTPSKDLVALSQRAEAQGFDAVVLPESFTDAMACGGGGAGHHPDHGRPLSHRCLVALPRPDGRHCRVVSPCEHGVWIADINRPWW